jgi:hypothetical protein
VTYIQEPEKCSFLSKVTTELGKVLSDMCRHLRESGDQDFSFPRNDEGEGTSFFCRCSMSSVKMEETEDQREERRHDREMRFGSTNQVGDGAVRRLCALSPVQR